MPVLFALGWVSARVDIRQMLSETRMLPDSYFKGLNFLLNEDPDRAIDAFIEVAKLDPETTELHFALGSLFRRRGEVERAIRVHQSLLNRSDLPQHDREMAKYSLAQDYLKAGLLDRAEAAFLDVINTRYAAEAVRALIRIYESGHEWDNAIATVKRLQALVNEPVPQLAHYYCEQALAALHQTTPDLVTAAEKLDMAEASANLIDGGVASGAMARIAMLRATIAMRNGDVQSQCSYLLSVLKIAPQYASLVAKDLLNCFSQSNNLDEGIKILMAHHERHPSLEVFGVVFKSLRKQKDHDTAWEFARSALRINPSLLGLDRVLEAELSDTSSHSPDSDFSLLRVIIGKHTQRLDRFSCNTCGFEARNYYWQCPGCNGWETYAPLRLEEIK